MSDEEPGYEVTRSLDLFGRPARLLDGSFEWASETRRSNAPSINAMRALRRLETRGSHPHYSRPDRSGKSAAKKASNTESARISLCRKPLIGGEHICELHDGGPMRNEAYKLDDLSHCPRNSFPCAAEARLHACKQHT